MLKNIAKTLFYLLLALIFVSIVIYANVWIIHWAIGLFTPISMWQAFGLFVLLSLVTSAIRGANIDRS